MKPQVDQKKIKIRKEENLEEINKVLEKLKIEIKDVPDDLFSTNEEFSLIVKKYLKEK